MFLLNASFNSMFGFKISSPTWFKDLVLVVMDGDISELLQGLIFLSLFADDVSLFHPLFLSCIELLPMTSSWRGYHNLFIYFQTQIFCVKFLESRINSRSNLFLPLFYPFFTWQSPVFFLLLLLFLLSLQCAWMAHFLVITFIAGLVPGLIVGLFNWRFVRSFYSFRFRDVFLVASV